MLNKKRVFTFFAVVINLLFIIHAYFCLASVGYENSYGSLIPLLHLLVFGFGLLVLLVSKIERFTRFCLFWTIWMFWLFIDFYVLGLRGQGLSNYFTAVFPPISFLIFYEIGLNSDKAERVSILSMFVVFVMSVWFCVLNLRNMNVLIGEETGITNLVFWCICALPCLFLAKREWVRTALLLLCVLIVIITGKRSAFIMIALIVVGYFIYSTRNSKHRFAKTMLLVMALVFLYFIFYQYVSGSFEGLWIRMNSIQDDEGSGRIPLYRDVLAVLRQNDIADWLVGRGCGSIKITRHSNAHNDFLQMLFEYGAVGVIFYLSLFFAILRRLIMCRRIQSDCYMGYFSTLVIFVVYGLVGNLVVYYNLFSLVCAFWGMTEAMLVKNDKIKTVCIV